MGKRHVLPKWKNLLCIDHERSIEPNYLRQEVNISRLSLLFKRAFRVWGINVSLFPEVSHFLPCYWLIEFKIASKLATENFELMPKIERE